MNNVIFLGGCKNITMYVNSFVEDLTSDKITKISFGNVLYMEMAYNIM